MQVQKQIADYDFQLQVCFKQLKRINVRVKLMDQLKKAPFVYLSSLRETMRRINFSKSYKNVTINSQIQTSPNQKAYFLFKFQVCKSNPQFSKSSVQQRNDAQTEL
jgi:hypothetical protein